MFPTSVCLCFHQYLSCALIYIIVLLCRFSHEQQWKLLEVHRLNKPRYTKLYSLVLCCLVGKNVVDSGDNSALENSVKLT